MYSYTGLQEAVEGNVVNGNEFVQRPLIVYQCGIYRQLAVVSDN